MRAFSCAKSLFFKVFEGGIERKRMSGRRAPPTIRYNSTLNEIIVKFYSDDRFSYEGFLAYYLGIAEGYISTKHRY